MVSGLQKYDFIFCYLMMKFIKIYHGFFLCLVLYFSVCVLACVYVLRVCAIVISYISANVYFHGYLHVLKYQMIRYEMYDIRYLTLSRFATNVLYQAARFTEHYI